MEGLARRLENGTLSFSGVSDLGSAVVACATSTEVAAFADSLGRDDLEARVFRWTLVAVVAGGILIALFLCIRNRCGARVVVS